MLKPGSRVFILENMAEKVKQSKQRTDLRQSKEVQAAIDYGIDISMLIHNVSRSYTERIRRHQIALNTVEKLRKVKYIW